MLDPVIEMRAVAAPTAGAAHGLPDLLLLERARSRDARAQEMLTRRYAQRVYRIARSVLGVDATRCGTTQCGCAFARSSVSPADSVGLSSIYTRSDEVIDWHACVDLCAQNHEVPGGHLSLPVNRHVYRLLAETLAANHAIRKSGSSGAVRAVTPTCEPSAPSEQHPA